MGNSLSGNRSLRYRLSNKFRVVYKKNSVSFHRPNTQTVGSFIFYHQLTPQFIEKLNGYNLK